MTLRSNCIVYYNTARPSTSNTLPAYAITLLLVLLKHTRDLFSWNRALSISFSVSPLASSSSLLDWNWFDSQLDLHVLNYAIFDWLCNITEYTRRQCCTNRETGIEWEAERQRAYFGNKRAFDLFFALGCKSQYNIYVELRRPLLKPRAVPRNSIRTSIKNSWILLGSKRESTYDDHHHAGTSIQLLVNYYFSRTIGSYRSITLRILPT